MATVPEEDEPSKSPLGTFQEEFPDFVRKTVTGTSTGLRIDVATLFVLVFVCLITAPTAYAITGVVCLFLLSLRWSNR
jgi:hypothetical protein